MVALRKEFLAALTKNRGKSSESDMTDVEFLASAGMQVLMVTHNRLGENTRFAVVADGPATSRPLKITGIADYIEVFSSLDVALTSFSE